MIKPQFEDLIYMRISAWSHNTEEDYQALHNHLHSNLSLKYTTSQQLKAQYLEIWSLYDRLFSAIKAGGLFARGERLRHHLIFYSGHTATFFINKMVTGKFLDPSERIDAHFESIFAVGVDEMSWDDILEDNYDWNFA